MINMRRKQEREREMQQSHDLDMLDDFANGHT